jgi:hypothetical protein
MSKATNWREFLTERKITVHPAADLYPDIVNAELTELAKDISKNGVQVGLVFLIEGEGSNKQHWFLDGRQRCAAVWAVFGAEDCESVLESMINTGGRVRLADGQEAKVAAPIVFHKNRGAELPQTADDTPDFDPYSYILSLNRHRRNLTNKQLREVIEKTLKLRPEMSDRQIAAAAKASPTTVGRIRSTLEKSGDVSKVDTRRDTAGRQQPATKRRPGAGRNGGKGPAVVSSKKATNGAAEETGDLFKVGPSTADTTEDKVIIWEPWDRGAPLPADRTEPEGASEPVTTAAGTAGTALSSGCPTDNARQKALEQLINQLVLLHRNPPWIEDITQTERLALAHTCLSVLKINPDDLRLSNVIPPA